jgi:Secretion system C-terminal sorting domain
MKNLFLLLTFLFFAPLVSAQTPFQKTIGGIGNDLGNAVQQTSDGGFIIAGETSSYGAGSRDVFLVKLDSLGITVFSKTFGGNAEDYALTMDQTMNGGYILGAHTGSFGQGGHDHYLIKTDSNGDTLFTRLYGGSAPDGIYNLHQTPDSGYILGGHTSSFGAGAHDFYLIKTDKIGDTLFTRTYGGNSSDNFRSVVSLELGANPSYVMVGETSGFGIGGLDILLIRVNGITGDTLWSKTLGGTGSDYAYGICESSDTGLVIIGHTNSFGVGGLDVYVTKTDLQGNILWSRTYGGSGTEYGYAIQQTSDKGYIIVGSSTSFGAGAQDIYLLKLDENGDTIWTKTYGGPNTEVGLAVQQCSDGGYIITGNTNSFGSGAKDIYVIKTDSNGNSGCNEFSTRTEINNASTIETRPNLILKSGTTMSISATIVNSATPDNVAECEIINPINAFIEDEKPVKVFPNPFSESALLQFDYKPGSYSLSLYSSQGQLFREIKKIKTGKIRIEKDGLPKGLYFFQIHNGQEITGRGKLIVE